MPISIIQVLTNKKNCLKLDKISTQIKDFKLSISFPI